MDITDSIKNVLCDSFQKAYCKVLNDSLHVNTALRRYEFPRMFRAYFQTELENRFEIKHLVEDTTAYLEFKLGDTIFIVDNYKNIDRKTQKKTDYIGQGLLFDNDDLSENKQRYYLLYDISEDSLSLDMVPVDSDSNGVNIFRGFEELNIRAQQADETMIKDSFVIKTAEVTEDIDFKLLATVAEEKENV